MGLYFDKIPSVALKAQCHGNAPPKTVIFALMIFFGKHFISSRRKRFVDLQKFLHSAWWFILSRLTLSGLSRPPRRSVSDGGGGGDFHFLATQKEEEKITLNVTPNNLWKHIFTGCYGTQHARDSSGHPWSSWETVAHEEILFLRVWSGPRHQPHDCYFWAHNWVPSTSWSAFLVVVL